MPEGQVLEFTHVTKRFGDVTALSDFSARIEPGAVTGLLGPNGAGKTTSLRILLGQVRATSGTATIGGVPYFDMRQPLRTVGSVLEETAYRPRRTAARQLQIAAKANGIPLTRVTEVLDLVGLHGDANTRIGTFSLGMRQRLSLATALLGDPGVLVLDEPANGLDPEGIRWMRLLMRRLADEGRTVLVSSHVLSEVEQVADDVVVLSKGQAVYTGGIDVLSDPTTGAVIVDAEDRSPLTAALAAAGLEFDVLRSGVTVRGSDAAAIGAIAASAGVALTVLQQRGPSLEEVFLDLVYGRRSEPVLPSDAVQTDAAAESGDAGSIESEAGDAGDAGADGAAEAAATGAVDAEVASEAADADADDAGFTAAGAVAAGGAIAGAFGVGAASVADVAEADEAADADDTSSADEDVSTGTVAAGLFGTGAAPQADDTAAADDADVADAVAPTDAVADEAAAAGGFDGEAATASADTNPGDAEGGVEAETADAESAQESDDAASAADTAVADDAELDGADADDIAASLTAGAVAAGAVDGGSGAEGDDVAETDTATDEAASSAEVAQDAEGSADVEAASADGHEPAEDAAGTGDIDTMSTAETDDEADEDDAGLAESSSGADEGTASDAADPEGDEPEEATAADEGSLDDGAADAADMTADADAEPATEATDAASDAPAEEPSSEAPAQDDATVADEGDGAAAAVAPDDDTDMVVEAEPEDSGRSPISHVPLPFATSAISLPGETVEPTFTELITGLPATGAIDLGAAEEIDDAVDDAVDDVPIEAHEVFAPLLSRNIDDAGDGEPAEAGTPNAEESDDPRLASMRNSLAAARKAYFEDPAPAWPYGKAPDSEPEASESEAADESDEDSGLKD
ncbi:ATP-binding cassette domain-containing protein [Microbacterium sp. NPDC057659]|uniref:ATP-binding cassette domain-containing protein n=1 Tax=Microbacterium sp. NPDC057659 TaxID=3346198 RepID=UPI00366EF804